MATTLNELRLQLERLDYDNKESLITIDILKEQQTDSSAEIEELRKQVIEVKSSGKEGGEKEDKEKKKAEKMALMMAKFDTVSYTRLHPRGPRPNHTKRSSIVLDLQQGAFSEKEEQLRATIAKLDSIDSESELSGSLTSEDLTLLRRQLTEGQTLLRDTVDRLRQSQEENELLTRRRDEVEGRLATLEAEYEELLEKTIQDEEKSDVDVAESMADLKVRHIPY
jgi:kinesin family protein 5